MPWRESSVLEERIKFVVVASRRERTLAELCREFGISRQTGYTWLQRYTAEGVKGMADRSRRPLRTPSRTGRDMEAAVVALRQRWPDWGARKLQVWLQQQRDGTAISVRTIHRILERHHLIDDGERHQPALKRFERSAPNELWQMDFKGPHGLGQTWPVGPLSIQDDHSRYLLVLRQVGSTRMEGVKATLQQAFEQAGLPEAMLMDHGTPWWNASGSWGWTELSVWIMRQGIQLLLSGIGHPQTQGKVERMHSALQRAVRRRKVHADQSWLDSFRQEYNHLRPHEALAMATPASRWSPSPRSFRPAPPEWEYPNSMEAVKLGGDGQLSWQGRRWEISNALRRQLVGIERIGERAIVYFCRTPIRELHLPTGTAFSIPVPFGSLQC